MGLINKETALKSVAFDTEAYSAVNMIPTIDAVEVVRCKDCVYWDTSWLSRYGAGFHYCSMIDYVSEGEFYCKEGEREIENGN